MPFRSFRVEGHEFGYIFIPSKFSAHAPYKTAWLRYEDGLRRKTCGTNSKALASLTAI
jgi:hypothetical protein